MRRAGFCVFGGMSICLFGCTIGVLQIYKLIGLKSKFAPDQSTIQKCGIYSTTEISRGFCGLIEIRISFMRST